MKTCPPCGSTRVRNNFWNIDSEFVRLACLKCRYINKVDKSNEFMNTGKQVKWQGKNLGYYIKHPKGLVFIAPRRRYDDGPKKSHYFRLYNGYGLNELFFKHLLDIGIHEIRIIEQDTKRVLISSPNDWKNKGIPHRSKGYEPQLILREKDFKEVKS